MKAWESYESSHLVKAIDTCVQFFGDHPDWTPLRRRFLNKEMNGCCGLTAILFQLVGIQPYVDEHMYAPNNYEMVFRGLSDLASSGQLRFDKNGFMHGWDGMTEEEMEYERKKGKLNSFTSEAFHAGVEAWSKVSV